MESPVIVQPDQFTITLSYPAISSLRSPISKDKAVDIKTAVARAFIPLLEEDLKRSKREKTIERVFHPANSFDCSYCLSTLLTGYCCAKCGRDYCYKCAYRIKDASDRHRRRIKELADATITEMDSVVEEPLTSNPDIITEVKQESSVGLMKKEDDIKAEEDMRKEIAASLIGMSESGIKFETIDYIPEGLYQKRSYTNASSVSLPTFSKVKPSSPISSGSLTPVSTPHSPKSPVQEITEITEEVISTKSKLNTKIAEAIKSIRPSDTLKEESSKTQARMDERLCECIRVESLGHTFGDLFPFTCFSSEKLKQVLDDMESHMTWQLNNTDREKAAQDEQLRYLFHQETEDSLPFMHIDMSSNTIDEDLFRKVCATGQTIVIHGTKPSFKLSWDPEYFITHYGDLKCKVQTKDDPNNAGEKSTISEFFSMFEDENRPYGFFKLKDWPTNANFSEALPELFEDFCQALPVPSIMGFNGSLNLASYFAQEANIPDLGPKLYAASKGVKEKGGKGSTTLHMDVASAVNIMTYTSAAEGEAGAIWDIYPAESSQKLREYLDVYCFRILQAEEPSLTWEQYQIIYDNQIHAQQIYIDEDMRKELASPPFNVKSWRIYQRLGDTVYVPAGCAHQVCNLEDCIKIAIDFIDMENLDRVVQLSNEFRQQTKYMSWKADLLQVRLLFFYVWNALTCQTISEVSNK